MTFPPFTSVHNWRPPDLLTLCTPEGGVRIVTPEQWATKREAILQVWRQLLGPFPSSVVPLEPKVHEETREEGYWRRKVSYAVEAGERVPAYLLLPDPLDAPRPAVLCLHPTAPQGKAVPVGLEGKTGLAYALHLVRRGFVTLAPDHITAGERLAPDEKPYETAPFYRRHPEWSAVGKMIWDHQRAIDYLRSLEFVDGERIGVIGHSLGGHGAVFTATLDERVKAVVSSCGWTALATDPNPFRWARDHWYVYLPRLRPFLSKGTLPFEWHEIMALLAPRPYFDSTASQDEVFPHTETVPLLLDALRKVYRLWNAEERLETFYFDGGHSFPQPARERAYAFLEKWLMRKSTEAIAPFPTD